MRKDSSKTRWIPLSPEQELFWLYNRFTGDSLNIIFKIELDATIEPTRVDKSFNAVVAAHDIFWYQAAKYTARQKLGTVQHIAIEQGEYQQKDRKELDEVLTQLKKPFSLTGGTKLRARLMQNPDSSYTFYIAAPHYVIDYVTMILINKAFMRHLKGEPMPDEKPASYSEYIGSYYTDEALEQRLENLEYWQQTLKSARPFLLQRAYIPTGAADLRHVHLRFTPQRYAEITTSAKILGIPDPIFFYACIYTALHLLTGSSDFVFSFMFAVKRNGKTANTFGPMIGLLPIAYSFSSGDTVAETVLQIYRSVKMEHKQKRFLPNIDLLSATPALLKRLPLKYSILSGLYKALYIVFGKNMIAAKNVSGALYKAKEAGLAKFADQDSEPYEVMYNPRLSRDMKGETYSSWITDGTQTLAMSGDDEASDHSPEGIYFTLNYDTRNDIELHSTPFINPAGQQIYTALLERIFEELITGGNIPLGKLATQP